MCRESHPLGLRIVVLGVGNILLKDEGIGVHAARALQEMPLDEGMEVIDGGTSPDIIPLVEGADKLIVIDAALGGEEPGTIYRFRPEDIVAESVGLVSAHQMSFVENLRTMKGLGVEPREVVIIGVEPKEMDWGLEPSPELRERIPEIVKAVLQEAKGRADGFDASPEEGRAFRGPIRRRTGEDRQAESGGKIQGRGDHLRRRRFSA